jgi:hypothetical protein
LWSCTSSSWSGMFQIVPLLALCIGGGTIQTLMQPLHAPDGDDARRSGRWASKAWRRRSSISGAGFCLDHWCTNPHRAREAVEAQVDLSYHRRRLWSCRPKSCTPGIYWGHSSSGVKNSSNSRSPQTPSPVMPYTLEPPTAHLRRHYGPPRFSPAINN